MSVTSKFSSKGIKGWLEQETSSMLIPIHAEAEKLLNDMRKTIELLSEVSTMLLENSQKEIEKRNMKTYRRARALNKLAKLFVKRTGKMIVPDNIAYDSFNDFVQETQKALLVTEVDVRKWFDRISPFFILDRRKFQVVFEKAKNTWKDLHNFLTKEYIKVKSLEETYELIDRLQSLEQQLADLKGQEAKTGADMAQVERETSDLHNKMSELTSEGSLSELGQIDKEIGALSAEVKHCLRHLQKPFIKLQSLAFRGEGSGLTPEEFSKLNQYVEDPFQAFATEEVGYPLLKQILQKFTRATSKEKLRLKSDKMRKAEQATENILNQNSLASLHQKCMNIVMHRKRLSTSSDVKETKKDLSQLGEQLEELETKKKIVEIEQTTLEQAREEIEVKIQNHKTQIEKNVLGFLNKRVHIE